MNLHEDKFAFEYYQSGSLKIAALDPIFWKKTTMLRYCLESWQAKQSRVAGLF